MPTIITALLAHNDLPPAFNQRNIPKLITFIITNRSTGHTFVTSTRNTPEEQWEELATQALEGREGLLFDQIREQGELIFKIEEWGISDNPTEIKKMVREAQEDLNATPIQTKRVSEKREGESNSSLAAIEKMLHQIHKDTSHSNNQEPTSSQPHSDEKQSESEGLVTTAPQTRQTLSTDQAEEMRQVRMRIEARRRGMRKSTPTKKASRKKVTPVKAASAKTAALKLANGRTKSAEKERRIKEAIKLEKEQRAEKHQAQVENEADEMAAILNKLDARNKEATKIQRKR